MENQTKNLYLTVCGKGGVGKSSLSFQYREKEKDNDKIMFFDGDIKNLSLFNKYVECKAHMKVSKFKFYDESDPDNISKQRFVDLINELYVDRKKNSYFVDCSATVSENLPSFFEGLDESFNDVLEQYNIRIHLLFIIGGADLFNSSMQYHGKTTRIVAPFSQISSHVFLNELKDVNERNMESLEGKADHIHTFTLSNTGASAGTMIQIIESKGKGIESLDPLTATTFLSKIKILPSLGDLASEKMVPFPETE